MPTPWPSWLIAAHPERASADALREFLGTLSTYVREFNSRESRAGPNVHFIKDKFGYPEEDIQVGPDVSVYFLTGLRNADSVCRLG